MPPSRFEPGGCDILVTTHIALTRSKPTGGIHLMKQQKSEQRWGVVKNKRRSYGTTKPTELYINGPLPTQGIPHGGGWRAGGWSQYVSVLLESVTHIGHRPPCSHSGGDVIKGDTHHSHLQYVASLKHTLLGDVLGEEGSLGNV